MPRNPLILASGSPRRQELLQQAGIALEVHPAHICEEPHQGEDPTQYALRLAQEKAEKVAQEFPHRFVLGADTIVVVSGENLGKPRDARDAARMLRLLSGRSHQVTTAVCVIASAGKPDTRSSTTDVYFREITEHEIQHYIKTGEPMDKAGAYAIQGGAAVWVVRLAGDYSNVVGLPLPLVMEMLSEGGYMDD